jgi:membrane fusion protein (multidrug efflux system)
MMTEIVVPNSGRRIKPEMVAKVKLFRETRNDALMVPENVVQLVDRDRYVVYIAAGDTAAERRVTLGGREGNNIEVTSGLRAGDRLIVVGYQKLMNGTPVIVSE